MAENNASEYDAFEKAMQYGTINTTSLFETNKGALKISRGGGSVNIRISWATVIGASIGIIIAGILALIALSFVPLSFAYVPILIFAFVVFAYIGIKIANWSPMQRTTGEDLWTYITIILRQRLSTNDALFLGGKKPSKTILYSMAIGDSGSGDGVAIPCEQWLGTQPLYDAPPASPYVEDYRSPIEYYNQGEYKVIPSHLYEDGFRDRF